MKKAVAELTEEEMVAAWQRRDPDYDGLFCFAVKTTGIFCRPSCPSRPKRDNIQFFPTIGAAIQAGFRPCKRCQPELANGQPPEWISTLMRRATEAPDQTIKAADLRAEGVSPERLRRWFQKHLGMTFAAWCRGLRLSEAFTRIRRGRPMDDVILGHGFESHSGFRSAFTKAFGRPPGRSAACERLVVALFETPLGPMLAAASDQGVCQLEFADRRGLERSYAEMRRRFRLPVVPGDSAILTQLREELRGYFGGERREFDTPVVLTGTDFQERVWSELRRIPFGRTASYETIAQRIGSRTACRAVARANGTNRLYLLVPCHRVIAKDGSLSGYGGGVWRKQRLLDLERGLQRGESVGPTGADQSVRTT
jgi:AraC family transcriptional regulator, regulatory protein of adaptative response / methylated-DNA-[protein]-cysteine methyltransferase